MKKRLMFLLFAMLLLLATGCIPPPGSGVIYHNHGSGGYGHGHGGHHGGHGHHR